MAGRKRISIRIYKQHDLALLSLYYYGAPIPKMIKKVLYEYARGNKYTYNISRFEVSVDIKKMTMKRFDITIKDPATLDLLKQIQPKKVAPFCKHLLLSSVSPLPLTAFHTDSKFIKSAAKISSSQDFPVEKLRLKSIKIKEKPKPKKSDLFSIDLITNVKDIDKWTR